MPVIDESIEQYAIKYSKGLSPLAMLILSETRAAHEHANMLSGETQGIFLKMLCAMLQPDKVLEVGCFTGFSALCMAEGMPKGSTLHTIELRDDDAEKAKKYFDQKQTTAEIKLHLGDAKSIIPTLSEEWDFVFIDADKTGYIEYYELTLPRLKPGKFLLADNVLFHGEVVKKDVKGKNAKAIQAFNEHVAQDTRVTQVMLPVRDGLLLVQKL